MDTQEILSKIAKLKKAVESESDADVKASYNKKIAALEAQVAEAEAKVEKKEEKAASEEKKTLSEADEKIKKLEKALASESDPDVKARYQKKLNELKGTLKDVKEEIKEEKKEIAEQKKEIKQAVKEVKSVQKEVRKTAIKKAAKKKVERKKVETKKTKRKEKLQRVLSDLDAMIEKNKKLKSKYGSGYKGTGKPTDLERDAGRKAKPFGYRFVGKHDYRVPTEMQIKRGLKRGTIDYEARPNRADVNPDKKVKLAKGAQLPSSKSGYRLPNASEISDFKNYVKDFYGKDEIYDEFFPPNGATNEEINKAVKTYVKWATENDKWGGGDSFDREITRDIMFYNRGIRKNLEWIKFVKEAKKMADGGMMDDGGMAQGYDDREDERLSMEHGKISKKDFVGSHSRRERSRRDDAGFETRMKKGGKVGKSKEDRARYAKPAGWRWKEEAVTKRVIERKQLSMQPSKKMREKYPDLVYYEDRLNKADKKPTRTSADSI